MVSQPAIIQRILVVEDGDSAYNTGAKVAAKMAAAPAGDFTKVWQMTVAAQTIARWGYGTPQFPFNQGYGTFCALVKGTSSVMVEKTVEDKDGNEFTILVPDPDSPEAAMPPTAEEGIIQLSVENAPGTAERFQGRYATSGLHSGLPTGNGTYTAANALFTSNNDMTPIPMGDAEAVMDSKLVISYQPLLSTGTPNDAAFRLPSTLYA